MILYIFEIHGTADTLTNDMYLYVYGYTYSGTKNDIEHIYVYIFVHPPPPLPLHPHDTEYDTSHFFVFQEKTSSYEFAVYHFSERDQNYKNKS